MSQGFTTPLAVPIPVLKGGNGVTSLPSASYYQNAFTTLATSAATKILFQVSGWDTGSYMSSSRYTPLVPGTYLVNAGTYLQTTVTATQYLISLYKNGSDIGNHSNQKTNGTGQIPLALTRFVQMNGTTDYLEIYGYNGNASTTENTTGDIDTFFQVSWIGP